MPVMVGTNCINRIMSFIVDLIGNKKIKMNQTIKS